MFDPDDDERGKHGIKSVIVVLVSMIMGAELHGRLCGTERGLTRITVQAYTLIASI